MFFYMPTKVYFGESVIRNYGNEIQNYGVNALIVTGKNSAVKSGVIDDLEPLLNSLGIKFTIFNEIMENPEIKIVEKGKNIFLNNNCDFIIAVGGGSPLDAAKAISLMTANNLNNTEIYNAMLHKKAFPIIAIPTTSGTGSEVTQYSVLNNSETNIKAGFGSNLIFPKISFLDPSYTKTLNKTITRDTAIDALSHLLEGIYSVKYNEFLLPLIMTGVKLIFDNLKPCLSDLDNLKYREALMLASSYGGIVISHSSTTLQHSIGYPLTTVYGISHGLANGLVMKQIMELYEPYLNGRLDNLFNYLNITKLQFFDWLDSLEMSFNHCIDNVFIEKRVPEVLRSRNMALNPFAVSEKQIISIYHSLN